MPDVSGMSKTYFLIKLWGMVIMPLFLTVQGYKPHCHIGDDE
ncbi:hypothetical protein AC68_0575 [Escherichia coli 2-156-04_S4_C1]|nr:hypothetical protein AC68_0575 [Escherichia coli 2-156-04_S4_C1]